MYTLYIVLSVSRRFSSVYNEKLHLHDFVHAAVYQKKGSDSDRLMSFKKQQLKHHLFNIIISYRKYYRRFINLTTSRTGVIVRFWKYLCDHERSSIHQHSGFALGSYQSLYIYIYSFIMLCFNILCYV